MELKNYATKDISRVKSIYENIQKDLSAFSDIIRSVSDYQSDLNNNFVVTSTDRRRLSTDTSSSPHYVDGKAIDIDVDLLDTVDQSIMFLFALYLARSGNYRRVFLNVDVKHIHIDIDDRKMKTTPALYREKGNDIFLITDKDIPIILSALRCVKPSRLDYCKTVFFSGFTGSKMGCSLLILGALALGTVVKIFS